MPNRFSGISHQEYALRTRQAGQGAGIPAPSHPTAATPGSTAWGKPKGSSLGQTFTQPLCLCKLQREADAKKGK